MNWNSSSLYFIVRMLFLWLSRIAQYFRGNLLKPISLRIEKCCAVLLTAKKGDSFKIRWDVILNFSISHFYKSLFLFMEVSQPGHVNIFISTSNNTSISTAGLRLATNSTKLSTRPNLILLSCDFCSYFN